MTVAIWGIIACLFFFEARDLCHFAKYTKNEITQAEQLIKSGRFAEAIAKLENITIPNQNAQLNAEKYHNLGVLYLNAGLIENAHDNLLATLKYNHSNPEACYMLACISYESKRYEESLIWLDDAKKLGCVKPKMYALEQQLLEILNEPR
jgi:tetratricopeptide (TPR) repeat protein